MALIDCALAGPGMAFAICVARLREIEEARSKGPSVECSGPPNAGSTDDAKRRDLAGGAVPCKPTPQAERR